MALLIVLADSLCWGGNTRFMMGATMIGMWGVCALIAMVVAL